MHKNQSKGSEICGLKIRKITQNAIMHIHHNLKKKSDWAIPKNFDAKFSINWTFSFIKEEIQLRKFHHTLN